ncbi:hypothetical protein N7454_003423 [Penicillium verhagenii]|nr:hypothetical protein N7454_003423 [Penicillium verhagenii]
MAIASCATAYDSAVMAYDLSVVYFNPHAERPALIALYGLPGSGKSVLLDKLRKFEGDGIEDFVFFDEKRSHWARAPRGNNGKLRRLGGYSENSPPAVIAGNGMLWDEHRGHHRFMCSIPDFHAFTHIVYLEVPAAVTFAQRLADPKNRPDASIEHLQRWQNAEIAFLEEQCRERSLVFTKISPQTPVSELFDMFVEFREQTKTKEE